MPGGSSGGRAVHPSGLTVTAESQAGWAKGRRGPTLATRAPWGRGAAAAQPGSASMSWLARARQVATDMPAGLGCGRTFLGTFCFSGPAVPTRRAKMNGRDAVHGVPVLLSPRGPMRGLPHLRASLWGRAESLQGDSSWSLAHQCPSQDDLHSSSRSPTRSNAVARRACISEQLDQQTWLRVPTLPSTPWAA